VDRPSDDSSADGAISPLPSPVAEVESVESVASVAKPAPRRWRYHVALTPKQVFDRLRELPGVQAYESAAVPDFGGAVVDSDYTLELHEQRFTVHVGPPAARGQSATGMLRLLYLQGRLTPTDAGTLIELGFAYRRPRWALQRWVGFLALASLGLMWVLIGPGDLGKKALLYGMLLVVLGPVVAHDLLRSDRIEEQRKDLLNLIERSFGPIAIDEPHPDEPYRRRMIAGSSDEE
jgi:hypothetical protein